MERKSAEDKFFMEMEADLRANSKMTNQTAKVILNTRMQVA